MSEVAVNVPFDSNEIKEITTQELRKRLDSLGPLQGAKEYVAFSVNFNVTVRLRRAGEMDEEKQTLAWGSAERGKIHEPVTGEQVEDIVAANSSFESGDPNQERQARGMPLTVESKDGRGNVTRRKVTVKE